MPTQSLTASTTRYAAALTIALTSIASAVFLRACRGNFVRETVTQVLGYEQRAAAEHFFAGVGTPIAAALFFLTVTFILCWLSYHVCIRLRWTWARLAKHPTEVATIRDMPFIACIFGFGYVVLAALWECGQAYVGVYVGPSRGYIQWNQLCCDVGGAVVAVLLARGIAGRYPT